MSEGSSDLDARPSSSEEDSLLQPAPWEEDHDEIADGDDMDVDGLPPSASKPGGRASARDSELPQRDDNAPAPEAFVSVKGSRIHETGLIKPPSGVYDMSKGRGRGRPLDHESSGEEDDGYDPRADAERLLEQFDNGEFFRTGEDGEPIVVAPKPVKCTADMVAPLASAYALLRAFSWHLKLSPFSFPDLVEAICVPCPTPLMDEVHESVLRLLASNDTNAFRQMRKLNPALLDSVTWPEYLWEWLGIMLDVNTAWMYEQTDQAADDAPLGSRAVSGIEQGAGAPMAVDEANGAEAAASTRETAENDEEERLRAAAARAGVRERKAAAERLFAMKQADPEAFKCLMQASGAASRASAKQARKVEYYGLPPQVKAQVLGSLCDDLLDTATVRNEIARREQDHEWHCGLGGGGSAFGMFSAEEKAVRRAAITQAEDTEEPPEDGNVETCVLCGLAGSLLCCDGCPAAYHMRCLGETHRTVQIEEEWLCPECAAGGRHQSAGLRVPPCARLPDTGELGVILHGALLTVAPGPGRSVFEEADMRYLAGRDALDALTSSERVDVDHGRALQKLDNLDLPAPRPGEGARLYLNRYRMGWLGYALYVKQSIDNLERIFKRGRNNLGDIKFVPLAERQAPLPIIRFQWPSPSARPPTARAPLRCLRCVACDSPGDNACLNAVLLRGPSDADDYDALVDVQAASRLPSLVCAVMRLEKEMWGVLGRRWSGAEGAAELLEDEGVAMLVSEGTVEGQAVAAGLWHKRWVNSARDMSSVPAMAQALRQLEEAIPRAVLPPDWDCGNAAPHGVLEHHGATRARASRAKVSFSASSTKVVLSRDDFLAFDPNEGAPRLGKRHTAGGEKKRQQARAPPGFVVVHGYRCGKCGPCMHPHWKQGCKQRFVPEDKAEEIRAQVAAEKAAEKGVPPPAAPPPSVGTRRSARSSARRDDSDSAPVPDVARALGLEAPAGRGADSGALAAALQRLRAAREALDEEGVVPEAARPGEAAGGGAVGAEATEGDAGARTRNPYRRRAPGAAGRKGGEPRRFNRAAYMAVRWFQPPLPVKPALAPAPKAEPAPAPRGPVKRSKDGLELVDDLGDEALIPLAMRRAKRSRKETRSKEAPGHEDEKRDGPAPQPMISVAELHESQMFAVMDFRIQKEDGVDMLEGEPWQWIRTAKQFGGRSRALLPANVLRKTARSGGRGLVAGVNYRVKHREDLEISPRLHWLAKVWHAETASDLALHLRELDAVIAWDALRRPGDAEGQPWTSLQVCDKRLVDGPDGKDVEYLMEVDRRVIDTLMYSKGPLMDQLKAKHRHWHPAEEVPLWMVKAFEERTRRGAAVRALGLEGTSEEEWWEGEGVGLSLTFGGGSRYRTRRRDAIERARRGEDEEDDSAPILPGARPGVDLASIVLPDIQQKPIRGPKGRPRHFDPETGERLYCLCRTAKDPERPSRQCDSCGDFLHPECVGVEWEVMEGLQNYVCPRCEKKVRRAVENMQPKTRRRGSGRGRWEESEGGEDTSPESESGGEEGEAGEVEEGRGGVSSTKEDLAKALKCVRQLADQVEADIFLEPVPEDVPGYYASVKHPMDLGTVEINLVNGNYLTVREVWRDLEQIWKNCRQFNAQGSDIVADAVACQDVIGDLWAKAGLDKLPAPHGKATGNPAVVAGLDSAHEAIEEILDLEGASAFATPITDDIAPGYSSVIANPMDLGKIDKKLKKGHYGLPSEVWHDLRLIWDNCRAYNEAGTDIVDLCERLQREAEAIWERRGLARSAREFAQSHKGCQPVAEGRAPQAAAPAPEAELEGDLRRALAAVEKIKREPSAHWFRAPVPKAVAPDYADVIERPMDLGTLAMGIRQGKYGSVGEVYADLRLIWSNCIEYNGEDHDIVGVMRKVEAKAEQIWDDMSLSRGGE